MTYFEHLWLYFALVAGIVIVPGMDMLFVLANALVGGRCAGMAATAGIMLGGAAHTVIGLALVIVLATLIPAVFNVMLVAGSLYMMWIGRSLLRSTIQIDAIEIERPRPVGRIFLQGLITCLVNPKAWMFVLSVFPQFLKTEYGPLLPQAVVMGIMTVVVQGVDLWRAGACRGEGPRRAGVQSRRDDLDWPGSRSAAARCGGDHAL